MGDRLSGTSAAGEAAHCVCRATCAVEQTCCARCSAGEKWRWAVGRRAVMASPSRPPPKAAGPRRSWQRPSRSAIPARFVADGFRETGAAGWGGFTSGPHSARAKGLSSPHEHGGLSRTTESSCSFAGPQGPRACAHACCWCCAGARNPGSRWFSLGWLVMLAQDVWRSPRGAPRTVQHAVPPGCMRARREVGFLMESSSRGGGGDGGGELRCPTNQRCVYRSSPRRCAHVSTC